MGWSLQSASPAEQALFGEWNRLNTSYVGVNPPNSEHEVMRFRIEANAWAGRYDKHPEPILGFRPQDGTFGNFTGTVATNFVCQPTFPFYPCQDVVQVVEGTTRYYPPGRPPLDVYQQHIVERGADGREVMWQYWVSPGNFACPWYRDFEEALTANPFPSHGDCIRPVTGPVVAQTFDRNIVARPLTLPAVQPGDSCPITTGKRGAVPHHIFGGELWFGEGPVYFALAWKSSADDLATFALDPVPLEGSAHRAKTPWVAVPSYSGPILIRGRALDGSARALRFSATEAAPKDRLELAALAAPHAPASSLWWFWPSSMWVPGPGCYGVQIDTSDATEVVVFEAL